MYRSVVGARFAHGWGKRSKRLGHGSVMIQDMGMVGVTILIIPLNRITQHARDTTDWTMQNVTPRFEFLCYKSK